MTTAAEYLAAMTLEEKAALCTGLTTWTTIPVDRIGLPPIRFADGPHGIRRTLGSSSMAVGADNATCFPSAASIAATWNRDLVYEVGRATVGTGTAHGLAAEHEA